MNEGMYMKKVFEEKVCWSQRRWHKSDISVYLYVPMSTERLVFLYSVCISENTQ